MPSTSALLLGNCPGSWPTLGASTRPRPHLLLCAEGLRLQLFILALGNPQELFEVSLRKSQASLSSQSPAGVSKASNPAGAHKVPAPGGWWVGGGVEEL